MFSKFILIACLFPLCVLAQNTRPTLTVPIGHQQPAESIDCSFDGKLIVTGSTDNSFILWDAKTNFMIRRTTRDRPVQQVLFTPDATQLIVLLGYSAAVYGSGKKSTLELYDVKTGNLIRQLPFTASPGLAFLRSSPILMVPDYSTDLSDKKTNTLADLMAMGRYSDSMSDVLDRMPSGPSRDSLAALIEKKEEEYQKKMGMPDGSDPQKMQEYIKSMSQNLTPTENVAADIFKRNITLVDAYHFQMLSQLKDVPENMAMLYYNRKEYILKQKAGEANKEDKMVAWEIPDLLKVRSASDRVRVTKEFRFGGYVHDIETSPVNGLFAVNIDQHGIQLWQFDRSSPLATLQLKGSSISGMGFSDDGNTVYVCTQELPNFYIEAFSTTTFKQIFCKSLDFPLSATKIRTLPSRNSIVTNNTLGVLKLSFNGEGLVTMTGRAGRVGYYGFDKGDNEVYVNYNGMPDVTKQSRKMMEQAADLYAQENGKKLTKAEKDKWLKEQTDKIPKGWEDPKRYRGFNLRWDLIHGGASFQEAGDFMDTNKPLSADGNYQLSIDKFESTAKGQEGVMEQLLLRANEQLTEEQKQQMAFLLDPMKGINPLRSVSLNGPVTLLVNQKTKDTLSLINIDSTDWVMLLRNGYYMASGNGARALSYARGVEVLPFEQFDIKYNRPDLVLKAIGRSAPELVEAYRNAYRKRIKRLGIDTSQFRENFNLPEADFTNRDRINQEQTIPALTVAIKGQDKNTVLDRFNIWVNEVPVFGKNGRSTRAANRRTLDTTIQLVLSQGVNRIETSVLNAAGVESYRVPLFVEYKPAHPREEKLYFIGIGINKFADTARNLRYCEKDIRDLADRLRERYGQRMESILLFNEDVTIEKIRALKARLALTNEDDKVIIAYSGHGLLSKGYDYYLSTYAVNFNAPEQNGLAYEELEDLLDGIRARKKLLLLDACHSGEIDKEEMDRISAEQTDLAGSNVHAAQKGGKLPAGTPGKLGSRNSFELMQELFVNVGRSTGTTIISAAAGTQFALERGDLRNGVFTFSVLELLQPDRPISVNALKKYVGRRVSELTKGLQQPAMRNEIQNIDWQL